MNSKRQVSVLLVVFLFLSLIHPLPGEEESYERFVVRTWTYRDGTDAKGKLIVVTGAEATLRLEGQGTVRVPLAKLSVKDLNWIYEYHKRRKQLSFLPEEYRKLQTESAPVPEPKSEPPAKPESKPEPKPAPADPGKTGSPVDPMESYAPLTVRDWTMKDGSRFKAKFISLTPQHLILVKEPVETVRFSLDQISEKDRKWLLEFHRRNNMLGLIPPQFQNGELPQLPPGNTPPGPPEMKPLAGNTPGSLPRPATALPAPGQPAVADDDASVIKANTDIDPKLVAALTDFRVWSDKKGQKSEARFFGIEGRDVRFVGRVNGFITVPIGTLQQDDLQLLRDALKMHGRMDELPLVYREDLDPDLSPTKLKQIIRVNNHRKWTDLSGNSIGASYVKMKDGMITLLITKTSTMQEFPYLNFSPEDQEYVQERLQKEIPGNFFPANADTVLTPAEQQQGFRVWTDRSNRQLKGKFVRLAYGDSVAVLNTGKKEELFIADFFSDGDLSLLKPQKKQQSEQLAMNGSGNSGAGFQGRTNLPGMQNPGMNQGVNPGMNSAPGRPLFQYTIKCGMCEKTHVSDSPFFKSCPHCGVKEGDLIYKCSRCGKKFTSSGHGLSAPCPHCNPNQGNQQRVASNNSFTPTSNAGGGGFTSNESSGRSSSNYTSGYRTGRALGKLFFWGLAFVGFIAGALKLRG